MSDALAALAAALAAHDAAAARRSVGAMLLDRTAVDDVSQDTLISVAQSVPSFAGDSKFTTWVHRIARNRVVDQLGRSVGTVKSQVARGRALVAAGLGERC